MEKYAVIRTVPLVRKSGQLYHTHPPKAKPCYCREGMDETLSRFLPIVPSKREGK